MVGKPMGFKVKFWGVRGSIACPSPNHVVYGGNTSCIEVDVGGNPIILDAGTGIRNLGKMLAARGPAEGTILLTHTHWDHINGFPFFVPAFIKGSKYRIRAGHLISHGGIKGVFASQMSNPMFPVPLEALQAELLFEDFTAGETFILNGDVEIKTQPLVHPNGATGYRINHQGVSLCYITDTEHTPGKPNQDIIRFIEGADLVIYDSTYTDAEFPPKVGWGHSTWQEGIRICQAAHVHRLAIFHHDPEHDDQIMEHIEDEARNIWPGALVARDNMELTLA